MALRESYLQYVIVQGDTAQQLTESLNQELYRLRYLHPEVTFEGLTARISYQANFVRPLSLADEYEEVGVRFTCQDCPYFRPILKADGTEDKRVKWGDCEHAELGRTWRDCRACDHLFKALRSGEVRLCLA